MAIRLLATLTKTLSGSVHTEFNSIIPFLQNVLSFSSKSILKSNSSLKLESLYLINIFVKTHTTAQLIPFIPAVADIVVQSCHDDFYKVAGQSLVVIADLVPHLTALQSDGLGVLQKLFQVVWDINQLTLADLEVKQEALATLATLVSCTGSSLPSSIQPLIQDLYLERMQHDSLRLVAINSVTEMFSSTSRDAILKYFNMAQVISNLKNFILLAHYQTKLCVFNCLELLLGLVEPDVAHESIYAAIMDDLRSCFSVNSSDYQLLPRLLSLLNVVIVKFHHLLLEKIKHKLVPQLQQIICDNPHLVGGGSGLTELLKLWKTLSTVEPNVLYSVGLEKMVQMVKTENTLNETHWIIAKCIGESDLTSDYIQNLVVSFADILRQNDSPFALLKVVLLSIGYIGVKNDAALVIPDIAQVLFDLFDHTNEEVKNAAAFCFGMVTVGSLPKMLPSLLKAVGSKEHEYLSLLAIKETISHSSRESLESMSNEIWSILFQKATADLEEGTRNVISECLGKLALAHPPMFLPELRKLLSSPSSATRATVVSAIKYTFTNVDDAYDAILSPMIVEFLRLLEDAELAVRKAALATLNAAAHSKPHLIKHHLNELLRLLYKETLLREDLIIVVEMGPFKHKVDTGLDARKVTVCNVDCV